MSKLTKIRKENFKLSKLINKENKNAYSNMITYLKLSNLNEYNQELITQDISNMIIDAQSRNQNIDDIFGTDLKSFIDDVIDNAPKKVRVEKILDIFSYIMLFVNTILILNLFLTFLDYIIGKKDYKIIEINLLVSIITLAIPLLILFFMKNRTNKTLEMTGKTNTILFITGFLFAIFSSLIFDYFKFITIIRINILYYVLILVFGLIVQIVLNRYISRKFYNKVI
ncbi:hypothetical protein ACKA04_01720 [Helcococcus kunzii]|uniref:hypothetical protein n=1 Tax=Helcococcus kunzii TaxID=40091 RepID=UPI0038AB7418